MNAQSPETPQNMAGNKLENTIPSIDSVDVEIIASQFRVLGEPVRLKLLNALKGGEKTVNQLAALTRTTQANVSKHLRILKESRFVERRKRSSFVYYSLADKSAMELCNVIKLLLQKDSN